MSSYHGSILNGTTSGNIIIQIQEGKGGDGCHQYTTQNTVDIHVHVRVHVHEVIQVRIDSELEVLLEQSSPNFLHN